MPKPPTEEKSSSAMWLGPKVLGVWLHSQGLLVTHMWYRLRNCLRICSIIEVQICDLSVGSRPVWAGPSNLPGLKVQSDTLKTLTMILLDPPWSSTLSLCLWNVHCFGDHFCNPPWTVDESQLPAVESISGLATFVWPFCWSVKVWDAVGDIDICYMLISWSHGNHWKRHSGF